jgi:hypothetical protein
VTVADLLALSAPGVPKLMAHPLNTTEISIVSGNDVVRFQRMAGNLE